MAKPQHDHDDPHHPDTVRRNAVYAVIAGVGPDATRLAGDHDRWLAEIHKAPSDHWAALVQEVLDHSLDLKDLKARVAELRPKKEPKDEPAGEDAAPAA